ncbi:hypothetical protein imdm_2225 [gamma proteobacterium IMCC2047]|nr:hypothetical protein imdm_2225 [gamma proteobacterium IMCC2047]
MIEPTLESAVCFEQSFDTGKDSLRAQATLPSHTTFNSGFPVLDDRRLQHNIAA